MTILHARPLDADSFRPYGLVLAPAADRRLELIDELTNTRPAARPRLAMVEAPRLEVPFTATEMEHHAHSAQAFVPIGVSRYFVLVAPAAADGPDPDRIEAFVVDGQVGILYEAGVWHYPMRTLDRPGRFGVLTFVDGSSEDQRFVPLDNPVGVSLG